MGEDPKDVAAKLAAQKIQERYRRSVVLRKLRECPVEGVRNLSKEMRTAQACRDFREQQREKEARHRAALQGTYTSPIAMKILYQEDEEFAIRGLTKHYESVCMWETLTLRLLDDALCGRVGIMITYLNGLLDRSDREKIAAVFATVEKEYDVNDCPGLAVKAMGYARKAREEKDQGIDEEARKGKVLKDAARYKKIRDEEEAAATKIQAKFKGKQARKQTGGMLEKQKKEREEMEAVEREKRRLAREETRMMEEKEEEEKEKREAEAAIQREKDQALMGCLAAQEADWARTAQKEAEEKRAAEEAEKKKEEEEQAAAATKIQASFRGKKSRKEVEEKKE